MEARAKIPETIKQDKMLSCKSSLLSKVDNFRSGKFDKHDTHWRKVTRDPNILSITFIDEIKFADTHGYEIKPDLPSFLIKRLMRLNMKSRSSFPRVFCY